MILCSVGRLPGGRAFRWAERIDPLKLYREIERRGSAGVSSEYSLEQQRGGRVLDRRPSQPAAAGTTANDCGLAHGKRSPSQSNM